MNRKKVKTILQESASFENGKLHLTKKLDRKEYKIVCFQNIQPGRRGYSFRQKRSRLAICR